MGFTLWCFDNHAEWLHISENKSIIKLAWCPFCVINYFKMALMVIYSNAQKDMNVQEKPSCTIQVLKKHCSIMVYEIMQAM